MKHLVFFSGGLVSFEVARRVVDRYGIENTELLFTDTCVEDDDLYRFMIQAFQLLHGQPVTDLNINLPGPRDMADRKSALIGLASYCDRLFPSVTWISRWISPWELFMVEKYIGNSRVDVCSAGLKRDIAREYVSQYDPASVTLHMGFDPFEDFRHNKAAPRWLPYQLRAILIEDLDYDRSETESYLTKHGIAVPRLYKRGYLHNNCGGFCVKAGLSAASHLLQDNPEYYQYNADQEADWQRSTGKANTVLRIRRKGKAYPVTLEAFKTYDRATWVPEDGNGSGCGCMSGV